MIPISTLSVMFKAEIQIMPCETAAPRIKWLQEQFLIFLTSSTVTGNINFVGAMPRNLFIVSYWSSDSDRNLGQQCRSSYRTTFMGMNPDPFHLQQVHETLGSFVVRLHVF